MQPGSYADINLLRDDETRIDVKVRFELFKRGGRARVAIRGVYALATTSPAERARIADALLKALGLDETGPGVWTPGGAA